MARPPIPAIITSSTGETFDYPSMKDARAALKGLAKAAKGTDVTYTVAEAPKS